MAARTQLQQIVDALSEVYTEEGVVIWLQAGMTAIEWGAPRGPYTKFSALNMIKDGYGDYVLAKAQSLSGMVAT